MTYYDSSDKTFRIDLKEFEEQFKHELEYFKEYFQFNKEMFNSRKLKLDSRLKADIVQNPSLEVHFRYMYHLDFIKLPSYFYHSSIVSLYSLLENKLNSLCDIIQKETELVIGVNEIVGSNIIQRARKYLVKFADIDFSKVENEWQRIADFQKLRNVIVHNNSQIEISNSNKDDNSTIKLLNKFKGVEIDKQDGIFLMTKIEILYEFQTIIEKFISMIIGQLSECDFMKFNKAYRYRSFEGFPF